MIMSEGTIITIVIAVVLLGAILVFGRRLRKFRVKGPGGIEGRAEGGTPGANVAHNTVTGDRNEGTAEGDNASIIKNTIDGSDNKFTAKSGGA
jgi:hypothetical protein